MDIRYGKIWKDAVRRLKEIGQDDIEFVDAGLNKNRQEARDTAADLYVRYHYMLINKPNLSIKKFSIKNMLAKNKRFLNPVFLNIDNTHLIKICIVYILN